MKKIALLAALALALTIPAAADTAAAPETQARSAILISADTGEVLYEHNADARMLIASTTKILSAVVVLENCALDEEVEIDSRSAGKEGSSMYLRSGEVYTVEELLYGMLLVSGNDAASALAIHVSGSEEAFAELMNEKAAELGMTNSHFANPHGLDAEGHYSTARDMAVLGAYAMQDPDFERIVSSKSACVHGQELYNHNKLLGLYPGCIGIKTGYTMAAGRTLVSCAERDGARYICVTLDDRDDWDDHAALYDWAFENYEYVRAVDSAVTYRVSAVNGPEPYALAHAESDGYVLLPKGTEYSLELELPPFVVCPIRSGESAGTIYVTVDGERVCSVPLVYSDDAEPQNSIGLLERIAQFIRGLGRPIYLTEDET